MLLVLDFLLWLKSSGHKVKFDDGCKDAFYYLFYFFCYGQDLVVTRCNLMMNVKMHFVICFGFFTMAKIWWPQGVIWMFDLYVFGCFPEIFYCG